MDHALYLHEKLRYTHTVTVHVHMQTLSAAMIHEREYAWDSHFLPLSPGGLGNFQLGLPQSVPPQYNTLKDCSPDVLSMRLRVLYNFSDLMYKSWRLLNLDAKNPVILFSKMLNVWGKNDRIPDAPVFCPLSFHLSRFPLHAIVQGRQPSSGVSSEAFYHPRSTLYR